MTTRLPRPFAAWFKSRGWRPHDHQRDMLAAARAGAHTLLVAPTGGGKTLAGFLPSLIALAGGGRRGLHTLYISPLKALSVDVHRNLEVPVAEMALPIRAETRTGDTPQHKRRRQAIDPPEILLTTPESLALMLSYRDAAETFAGLRALIVDEVHALAGTKRGDLLALGLARLARLAPDCRRIGLSATVAWPEALRAWISPTAAADAVRLIHATGGAEARVEILVPEGDIPWSGHMGIHALPEVFRAIAEAGTTIVFVNTRAQAEAIFQHLWRLNEPNLPIALHHGSLAAEQRRKVEAAMARGDLRAVVATSSLDLGIDWGAVDLVVQIGAPKGSSRLIQRIGRAGHRLDTPSRALLVPTNRFEVLECRAALDAVEAGTLDGEAPGAGGLDVLAQHVLGSACAGPFEADGLYDEVRRAAPYANLSRADFDDTVGFVENGGYALGNYERYRRLRRQADGGYHVASGRIAHLYRMNVGTIVESPMLKVRMRRGRTLGEVEESFFLGLSKGDTFIFAGQLLSFEEIRETDAIVRRAVAGEPNIPSYGGGRFPMSTHLAARVRAMVQSPDSWHALPPAVAEWLELQRLHSCLPESNGLLVESFPRGGKHFLVAYCFEGRNAHQTLGMLLTRRMERFGFAPLGFVATDYSIAIWSVKPATDIDALFAEDMLGDDLEEWMEQSSMLRRIFRNAATVAGLIHRRYPGEQHSRRHMTVNSDLIYDVLRRYEPHHMLLRATRAEAAQGMADVRRLGDMLARVKGRISHRRLARVSPLAVPVLLEIGREQVYGQAFDELMDDAASRLIHEATEPEPAAEMAS